MRKQDRLRVREGYAVCEEQRGNSALFETTDWACRRRFP
jgi:hypothetical protein